MNLNFELFLIQDYTKLSNYSKINYSITKWSPFFPLIMIYVNDYRPDMTVQIDQSWTNCHFCFCGHYPFVLTVTGKCKFDCICAYMIQEMSDLKKKTIDDIYENNSVKISQEYNNKVVTNKDH